MIKTPSKQSGSAHITIVSILTVVIITVLGFLFWQNFINEKNNNSVPVSSNAVQKEEEKVDENKKYIGEIYSFSYPSTGWTLKEADKEQQTGPSLTSDDLTSEPFHIITGAAIYVHSFPFTETFDERLKTNQLVATTASDISKTTVDGIAADSYKLSYEGMRYITEFVKDNVTYQIRFEVAEGDEAQYENAYKLLVASFKFK